MRFFKQAKRKLRSQAGLSILEIIFATGVSGAVIYGGVTLMGLSGGLQKTTEGQSIVDRELAAGVQLANNPQRISDYVELTRLGDCLMRDQNADCAKFTNEGWKVYPSSTGPKGPVFHTLLNGIGPCANGATDKNCLVKREMKYRWVCTARSCTGLETRVSVTPLNALAEKIKPRETTIKLDRRQFMTRAQIAFVCDKPENRRSITGVDYGQLGDICKDYETSRCDLPHKTYQPAGSNDCREELNASCGQGFSAASLDNASGACAPPPGGRTVAGRSSGTDTTMNTSTTTTTRTDSGCTGPSCGTDPNSSSATRWRVYCCTVGSICEGGTPEHRGCMMDTSGPIPVRRPTDASYATSCTTAIGRDIGDIAPRDLGPCTTAGVSCVYPKNHSYVCE
jgi:hypothetical protein